MKATGDKITRGAAAEWLRQRRGMPTTVTIVVSGKPRESVGLLTEPRPNTFRVWDVQLDPNDPSLPDAFELRVDTADIDFLVLVWSDAVEARVRSWDESRPPRVWRLEDVAREMRGDS